MQLLAAGDVGYHVGRLVGMLLIPGIGALLLVLGLRRRAATRSGPVGPVGPVGPGPYPGVLQSPVPPGYPPPQGYPPPVPGYPPTVSGPGGLTRPVPGYPSPAPKPAGTPMIVVGAVLLALGLLGPVAAAVGRQGANTALRTGDCITNEQYQAGYMTPKPVDCTSPDAVFELATVGDGQMNCPDGRRMRSGYALLTSDSTTYCFIANFTEGACYRVDAETDDVARVDCTDPQANVEIARRIDGSTDVSNCDSDAHTVSFPTPPRAYCIVTPAEPI